MAVARRIRGGNTPGAPGPGKRLAPPQAWQVRRRDHYPAYMSWEQFERNQRQLAANGNAAQGAIRRGPSLLAGLVVCGRCGLRMSVVYTNNGTGLRYVCGQAKAHYEAPRCQALAGGRRSKPRSAPWGSRRSNLRP